MFVRRNNRNCPRYLLVGLCAGLLAGVAGGCRSKAKDKSAAPGETAQMQAINQEPGPLLVEGELVAGVLMQVQQEVITTSDVLSALAERLEKLGQVSPGQEFRGRASQLIVQYLRSRMADIVLLNEAEAGLDESRRTLVQRQVEAYKQQLLRDCDNSPTRLRNKLRAEGTTLQDQLKNFRRKLVVQTYLRSQFSGRINVTRQDIVDYYKQHHTRYNHPREVELLKIQIITAKHSENAEGLGEAEERARQIAQKAWNELSEGVGFEEVARKYSDVRQEQGGVWGQLNPANLKEANERQALKRLKEREHSQVLKNDLGYSIVSIAKIIPASQTPLEEVQEQIREVLSNKHFTRLYDQRLAQLSRRAVITASPSAMRMAVDLAERRFGRGPN